MLRRETVLVVFVLGVSCAWCSHPKKAEIEAFTPRGFRVAFKNEPGISQVHFDINIKKRHRMEHFLKNVRRMRDGKWTFVNRRFRLEIGDVVDCELLIVKNNHGYKIMSEPFVVKELIPLPPEVQPRKCENNMQASSLQEELRSLLNDCEESTSNATQTIMLLQDRVEKLAKMNHQLTSAIEKYPDAKKLTLGGRIPPDDSPLTTVKFILWEKLDLQPTIVSAVKNSDGSITFELPTVSEKLKILDEAKQRLRFSKILIY